MKKLLGIVVLGLLCSNISFAEMIQLKCKTKKISIMKGNKLENISGGGDTISALSSTKSDKQFSYISTAGGAFLEWVEGKKLPAIEALRY